jgi:hypothetical protein
VEHYAGIDVSLELSSVCVVDGRGKIEAEIGGQAAQPEAAVPQRLGEDAPGLEVRRLAVNPGRGLSDGYGTVSAPTSAHGHEAAGRSENEASGVNRTCRVNGLALAFEARSPGAISEGCPGLRSDRDRQRSTKGW